MGSQVLDGSGNPIDAYTNEDIVAFARIWTGFDRQPDRVTNTETLSGAGSDNIIDPMIVKADWRELDRGRRSRCAAGHS